MIIAPSMSEDILTLKSHLRELLRVERDHHVQMQDTTRDAESMLEALLDAKIIPEQALIASYWPSRSEADVRPLLSYFQKQGHICALPVIQAIDQALLFREWHPGDLLISGLFNIFTPDDTALLVTPTVIFVPLLGFDAKGHRLGQGGGYYDLTLANLRSHHHIIAIGIGFDCQEVDNIPTGPGDERLDYILTPTRVINITLEK